jgi:hypothetical protein
MPGVTSDSSRYRLHKKWSKRPSEIRGGKKATNTEIKQRAYTETVRISALADH